MFRPGNLGHLGRLGLVAASRNAFSPLSLFAAGEVGAWFDPSDLGTLFQDSAGTAPVTAVEQPVGRMLDKSGRGNHATQSTAINRPILRQDSGGNYYLYFNGTNTSMQTGNINMTNSNKVSVFAGINCLNIGSTTLGMVVNHNSTGFSSFSLLSPAGSGGNAVSFMVYGSNGGAAPNDTGLISPMRAVLTGTSDLSAPSVALRRDGVTRQTVTAFPGGGSFSNQPLMIGIQGGGIPQRRFNGHLYGLVVRGAESTSDQITNTERWLAAKTGVTM